MKYTITFTLCVFSLLPLFAQAKSSSMLPRYNVGGMMDASVATPHEFKPHPNPRALLPVDTKTTTYNKKIIRSVTQYLDRFPATTGLLMIDQGRILVEKYLGKGDRSSEFYSQSIGKSMTSLAFGKLLCSGHVSDLDVVANTLLPQLGNSGFGRSTLRQLLTMSSGAYKPVRFGQPVFRDGLGRHPKTGNPFSGLNWPIRLGQTTVKDVLWGQAWGTVLHKNPNAPGDKFIYKSGDTLAISKVIEQVSGKSTAAYFEDTIWHNIRGQHSGHWESDTEGSTVANAGFQVRLRDWGRIALWITDILKTEGCYSDYLKQSTTTQIPIAPNGKTVFEGYGFQWWTKNRISSGFWGLGYAGQMLGIDPQSGKIMIKFSYRNDKGSAVQLMKIFKEWTQNTR